MAQRLFPSGEAIGKHVSLGTHPQRQNLEVIAIVGDTKLFHHPKSDTLTVYLPCLQERKTTTSEFLEVHTEGEPAALAHAVGNQVEKLGSEYPLWTRALDEQRERSLVEERVLALLSEFFGALTLLVAALGLYGLTSYAVTCRTREIGTRVALGAQRGAVAWVILRETLILAVTGLAIGLVGVLGSGRLIGKLLFGFSATDPVMLVSVSGILLLACVGAAYFPVLRAMSVDPMTALRHE